MRATRPPVDYLASCSKSSLESLELSRLNVAANLRKQFHQILNDLIESEVDARLARTILEWRRGQHSLETNIGVPLLACQESNAASRLPTPEQLSIAFEAAESKRADLRNVPSAPSLESEESSYQRAPSAPQSPAFPQSNHLHQSQTPSLASGANGGAVESPRELRQIDKRKLLHLPQRKVLRIVRASLLAVNPIRDVLPHNSTRHAPSERAASPVGLVSAQLAQALFRVTAALAGHFA
jgi:hypothetical protein